MPYWNIFCWFNFRVCARYWLGEVLLNHKSTEQSTLGGGRFVHLSNTLYCSSDTSPCTKMLKHGMHCSWQPIAWYAVCRIATVLGRNYLRSCGLRSKIAMVPTNNKLLCRQLDSLEQISCTKKALLCNAAVARSKIEIHAWWLASCR